MHEVALKDAPAHPAHSLPESEAPLYGVVAEYDTEHKLIEASKVVRDAGFQRWDTHTPYPVHGIDEAMGTRATVLPLLVFGAGITGCIVAFGLQTFTNAIDYQFRVSGKPYISLPANIPIMFELTVLFSALTAFGAMMALNQLPLFYHPLFAVPRFLRATSDRFFVAIEAIDARFDRKAVHQMLAKTGATAVEDVYDKGNSRIPFVFFAIGIIVACFALIPPALVLKARFTRSPNPKIHLILDLDFQNKYKAQSANKFFADGRTSRAQVAGTVARGQLYEENEHLNTGKIDGKWATTFPFEVTEARLKRGQERFNIYCSVCHGLGGKGDGMVNRRAEQRMKENKESEWVAVANLHADAAGTPIHQTHGEIFNTITNGKGNMASYAPQISVEDRWNIVMYVRALQNSQRAAEKDVPASELPNLK
jgi:mono/diheme cytochrome c family protein